MINQNILKFKCSLGQIFQFFGLRLLSQEKEYFLEI